MEDLGRRLRNRRRLATTPYSTTKQDDTNSQHAITQQPQTIAQQIAQQYQGTWYMIIEVDYRSISIANNDAKGHTEKLRDPYLHVGHQRQIHDPIDSTRSELLVLLLQPTHIAVHTYPSQQDPRVREHSHQRLRQAGHTVRSCSDYFFVIRQASQTPRVPNDHLFFCILACYRHRSFRS